MDKDTPTSYAPAAVFVGTIRDWAEQNLAPEQAEGFVSQAVPDIECVCRCVEIAEDTEFFKIEISFRQKAFEGAVELNKYAYSALGMVESKRFRKDRFDEQIGKISEALNAIYNADGHAVIDRIGLNSVFLDQVFRRKINLPAERVPIDKLDPLPMELDVQKRFVKVLASHTSGAAQLQDIRPQQRSAGRPVDLIDSIFVMALVEAYEGATDSIVRRNKTKDMDMLDAILNRAMYEAKHREIEGRGSLDSETTRQAAQSVLQEVRDAFGPDVASPETQRLAWRSIANLISQPDNKQHKKTLEQVSKRPGRIDQKVRKRS